jgi:hypothetical protein
MKMNRTEIKTILDKLTVDIDAIADPHVAAIQRTLFNLIEILVSENEMLRETIQKLKDEISRLKGEQGKPDVRKQTKGGNNNHSSESYRKNCRNKKTHKPKNKKKQTVKIDRQITCEIDKRNLPDDAVFKGYEKRIVQDIKITTDNIEFKLSAYYSPSLNKTFIASLPESHYGEFGPGIRTFIITSYRDSGMTEPAIARFLEAHHIQISNATISRMITERHGCFHQEKEDIVNAGLKASPYQHLDDTTCRVNGKNHYAHILCSPYFTAFFTRQNKDRLTILEILCRNELKFKFNSNAYDLMSEFGLSNKRLVEIKENVREVVMTRCEIDDLLKQLFPNPKKHATTQHYT